MKRIADGDTGAATVLALLTKDYPDHAIKWMHALDENGIYGRDVWVGYSDVCGKSAVLFMKCLTTGDLKALIDARKSR